VIIFRAKNFLNRLRLFNSSMSENIQVKIGQKLPWVLGKGIRIPRVKFPDFDESSTWLPSPGKSLVLLAIYGFLFWLVAGGIYIMIRDPIALGANQQGQPLWLYPSTHDAFIIESVAAAAIIFLGGAGFVTMYNTTKNSFNYPYAIKLLVLGLVMSGVSFGLLQYMISQKGG
jgi:hypothetical protein